MLSYNGVRHIEPEYRGVYDAWLIVDSIERIYNNYQILNGYDGMGKVWDGRGIIVIRR